MPRRRVLLVGAGFSANWEGLLSKDIGSLLYSYARDIVCKDKDYLLTDQTYEEGWEHVFRVNPEQVDNLKRQFEDNLVKVFSFHQQCLTIRPESSELVNVAEFLRELLTYQCNEAILLTTNQDLLLEEARCKNFALLTPGVGSVRYNVTDGKTTYLPRELPKEFTPPQTISGCVPLIKLHGSFDWIYELRPVLITGVSKQPDEWPPYLLGALEWVKGWLAEQPVDLVIVGHAMADSYLVDVLSETCTKLWRVFIIDSSGPHEWFKNKDQFRSSPLMQTLHCYLPRKFRDLVNPGRVQSAYEMYSSEIHQPIITGM